MTSNLYYWHYFIMCRTLAVLGLSLQSSIFAFSKNNHKFVSSFTKTIKKLSTNNSHGRAFFFESSTLNATSAAIFFTRRAAHFVYQHPLKIFITCDQYQCMRLKNFKLKALYQKYLISFEIFSTYSHSSDFGFSVHLAKSRRSRKQWFTKKYLHKQETLVDSPKKDLFQVKVDNENSKIIGIKNRQNVKTHVHKRSLSWSEIQTRTPELSKRNEVFEEFRQDSAERSHNVSEVITAVKENAMFYQEECKNIVTAELKNLNFLNNDVKYFKSNDELIKETNDILLIAQNENKKLLTNNKDRLQNILIKIKQSIDLLDQLAKISAHISTVKLKHYKGIDENIDALVKKSAQCLNSINSLKNNLKELHSTFKNNMALLDQKILHSENNTNYCAIYIINLMHNYMQLQEEQNIITKDISFLQTSFFKIKKEKSIKKKYYSYIKKIKNALNIHLKKL